MTGRQLVFALQHKYDKGGSKWKLEDVRREMAEIEPSARSGRAAWVLAQLRGRYTLPRHQELLLLQGLVNALRDVGFGVILHRASAAAIRATIYLSAKSRYNQMCAVARKAGLPAVTMPFSPADLSQLLSKYPDGEEGAAPYIMGWTLIPPNVMQSFASFMPVDAFDCCHKRGAAQGTMAVRATKNANNRVQIISISDVIGPECSLSMRAVMDAEATLLSGSASAVGGESPCVLPILQYLLHCVLLCSLLISSHAPIAG